jgi:hypothetical protein
MRYRAFTLLFLLSLAPFGQAQRGALVKPRNLDELTSKAERIVHAHVLSAKVEPHPQYRNLSTIVVTMRVEDTLKGQAAQNLTFREFIWDFRDKHDAASYRKGQEIVLFLNKPTTDGLTSTSGVQQGRFAVEHERSGQAFVRANSANHVLLAGVDKRFVAKGKAMPPSLRAAQGSDAARITLADFKTAVRELAGGANTR